MTIRNSRTTIEFMSPREQVQNKIVEYLEQDAARWNAPYGILTGLHPVKNGKGKVRTITFGVSRYLDASIYIWSPDKITIQGQGGLAYKVEGTFNSSEAVIAHLQKV